MIVDSISQLYFCFIGIVDLIIDRAILTEKNFAISFFELFL